jgi:hypothetical protein
MHNEAMAVLPVSDAAGCAPQPPVIRLGTSLGREIVMGGST